MALRRSSRNKPVVSAETSDAVVIPSGPAPEEESSKSRKRAKAEVDSTTVAVEPRRRRRGILQKIKETPLDVLFEIFSYLELFDLLKLSRTTKDLRHILMSKSSAFVWESARLGMNGLPPMIKGLNDPQYANLVFDNHCHDCGKGQTKIVQWEVRLRLCAACLEKSSIMSSGVFSMFHDHLGITPSYVYVPIVQKTRGTKRRQRTQAQPEKTFIETRTYYHMPTYQRLSEENKATGGHKYTAENQEWHRLRRIEKTELAQESKLYDKWMLDRTNEHNDQIASVRAERLKSIEERLAADGWAKDLEDKVILNKLRDHKLVKEPKPLTERIWLNLRFRLADVINDIKAGILKEKINTAVARRSASL